MAKFVIAMGAAPHLKLSASGDDFHASGPFMAFDSHDAAFDFVAAQTETPPLQGVRAVIVEDLALEDEAPD
ncbi:hypothetical protein PANO111632_20230 [Paracoccus nototheniae]|uniref:YCII-related domain-containing protein n=1 Tax=Paracoccus nototheniae TaxID=2489002 RepID=A0ABW4DW70_9RHOB|nr:hypothetical protein [Paracoccus nototheniae]